MIESEVRKADSTPVPDSAVRAEAWRHALRAFDTYDPDKAALSTHVGNNLKRVNRFVAQFQTAMSIPEARRLKIRMFQNAMDDYRDRHGREPPTQELSDELAWSPAEVGRMRRELRGEVLETTSPVLMDFGYESDDRDREVALQYVYPELGPREKLVFEHTFGWKGRPVLSSNKEIAETVGVSETTVRNTKKEIAHKLMPFIEG